MVDYQFNPDDIAELRASFLKRRLQFLVGAGASMAAGLPSWVELNSKLIADYFNTIGGRGSAQEAIGYDPEELDALSDCFQEHFGRDAVIDLLRLNLNDEKEFHRHLHKALYQGKDHFDLQPLHFELAVAARALGEGGEPGLLYTLNYDDALEQAIELVTGVRPTSFTKEAHLSGLGVVHLHGYLPLSSECAEEPEVHGDLILSEEDFFRSRGANPDQKLKQLLEDQNLDVVLIGTSMADPRLRRLIFENLEAAEAGRIWVFLTRPEPSQSDELARRRALRTVANHVKPFWEHRRVTVVEFSNYELIPMALRVIRLGEDLAVWLEKGRAFLEENEKLEGIFDFDAQFRGQVYLLRQHDFIRDRFSVASDERLTLSFFIPVSEESENQEVSWCLEPVFRFSDLRWKHRALGEVKTLDVSGDKANLLKEMQISPASPHIKNGRLHLQFMDADSAEQRRLAMRSLFDYEGSTGVALVTGIIADAREREALFSGFDKKKQSEWEDEQTYSALLSVPVYDSAEWVPLGVACLASNRSTPFWDRLDQGEHRNLERYLRSMFRNLFEYTSCF